MRTLRTLHLFAYRKRLAIASTLAAMIGSFGAAGTFDAARAAGDAANADANAPELSSVLAYPPYPPIPMPAPRIEPLTGLVLTTNSEVMVSTGYYWPFRVAPQQNTEDQRNR